MVDIHTPTTMDCSSSFNILSSDGGIDFQFVCMIYGLNFIHDKICPCRLQDEQWDWLGCILWRACCVFVFLLQMKTSTTDYEAFNIRAYTLRADYRPKCLLLDSLTLNVAITQAFKGMAKYNLINNFQTGARYSPPQCLIPVLRANNFNFPDNKHL